MDRMIIGIGSDNPSKIQAAEYILSFFPQSSFKSFRVPSGVSAQPFSDEETRQGAINRSLNCVLEGADLGIGLEGGVMHMSDGIYLCNWGALSDNKGFSASAAGARIKLPDSITKPLLQGEELGSVMASFTEKADIRKKEGAIGIFTYELMSRKDMFQHIITLLAGQYLYQLNQKQAP